MIEEQAFILEMTGHNALVEIKRQSSCQGCDAQSGCGINSLSRLFGQRPAQFTLDLSNVSTSDTLKAGDAIMIGLDDLSYLSASVLIYLLPLVFLFSFALLSEQVLGFGDFYTVLASVFGLWFGFQIAKQQARKKQALLSPQFIKKV